MSPSQKRKVEEVVEADATTPRDGTKQRRSCETEALTYMQTTPENLQDHLYMIEEQMQKSSEEKQETNCSEKDWWDVARDYLQGDKIGDNCFLTIVQANESGDLIAFNAYSCSDERMICDYVYVRRDYRQRGIASRMLDESKIRYAHAMKAAEPFWEAWAKKNNCTFQTETPWMWTVADRDAKLRHR